jgi:hypothetical protein
MGTPQLAVGWVEKENDVLLGDSADSFVVIDGN